MANPLRRLLRRFRGERRARPRPRTLLSRPQAVMLGSEYGGYIVDESRLGPDSVVYSVGIGEDASFDFSLIERCGTTVHAFDPTPRSIAWVEAQSGPQQFFFHPWGVAGYDGVARFTPPVDPTHVSHTVLSREAASGPPIEVEVRRLRTVMRELGHERLDVLKMDIEGAEYEVIEDLLASAIPVDQLLLEFHHHLPGVALERTEAAIDALEAAGYRIFGMRESGRELSFIRVEPVALAG